MKLERQAAKELRSQLETQLQTVTDGLTEATAQEALTRLTENEGPLRDAVRRMLLEASLAGVGAAATHLETIGLGVDWTLANEAARAWVKAYTFDLVRGIQETSRTAIRDAIAEWVQNGEPLARLTKELEPTFGKRRAELIAATEVTRAYAEGNIQSWIASGLVEGRPGRVPPAHPRCRCWLVIEEQNGVWVYVWRTSEDERVCPTCGPLANQVV